jgi:hypothetical protein
VCARVCVFVCVSVCVCVCVCACVCVCVCVYAVACVFSGVHFSNGALCCSCTCSKQLAPN